MSIEPLRDSVRHSVWDQARPHHWCAHVPELCYVAAEFWDEVTGEWWCRAHAGPLAWSEHVIDAHEMERAQRLPCPSQGGVT